ncbi:PAS domain-containing protein [Aureococcus anophagefferens]|nr:PAS domain-containing protein [Aureococcus anophagefferens]
MGMPGDLGLTGFVPSAWTDDMDFMCEGLREDRTRRRSSSKSDDSDKSSGSGGRHAASRFKAHAADPRRGRSGSSAARRRATAPRRRARARGPPRRDDLIAPLPAFATGYDAYALHAPPPPLRPAPEPAGFG